MHPIFQGSNDRAYQILATWVNKLHSTSGAESAARPKATLGSPPIEPGENFASQRVHTADATEQVGNTTGPFVTGPVTNKTSPPVRFVPGKGVIPDTSVDPNEFPLPFAVSGTKPQSGSQPPLTQTPESKTGKPGRSTGTDPTAGGRSAASAAAAGQKKAGPSHSTDTAAKADPEASMNNARPPEDTDAAKKKPKKPPLTLDPNLLQRALQIRNQGREPGTP